MSKWDHQLRVELIESCACCSVLLYVANLEQVIGRFYDHQVDVLIGFKLRGNVPALRGFRITLEHVDLLIALFGAETVERIQYILHVIFRLPVNDRAAGRGASEEWFAL